MANKFGKLLDLRYATLDISFKTGALAALLLVAFFFPLLNGMTFKQKVAMFLLLWAALILVFYPLFYPVMAKLDNWLDRKLSRPPTQ